MVIKDIALGAFLFLVNFYVCRGLYSTEYLRHMGSIEAAYIGISRYAIAHWRDLSWFPLWYEGIPYQNTYPPLLHWTVALYAWARGISTAHAHHWVTAFAYCLGPVAVFALVRVMSGSRWAGLTAGMLYSALSPSAWLMPQIALDIGGAFRPRRLQTLVVWGEGPHVSAMTLLPLAILAVHLAATKRRPVYVLAAAVSLAAVVLTNWIAGFALALGVVAYLVARGKNFLLVGVIGVAAYCLAMPWAPPSTIAVTQYNARFVVGDFRTVYQTLPVALAGIACGLAVLKLAARRLPAELQFAIYFAALMSAITLADGWFHFAIVPQPARYHLEMEMALAMLAALGGYEVFRRRPRRAAAAAIVVLAILLIQPMRISRRYARLMIQGIDITQTSEWKTADWLNRHWSGERVMLPGSSMFWLNAFSDVPQMGGGYAQGITDSVLPAASYGLTAGKGPGWAEYGVLWLKALGVQAVGVSGPGSTEVYKDFVDPKKFDGVLEVLWRDGGDVLYRVGTPHASLARVVPRASLVPRTPIHGGDVEPLEKYVAALDDLRMPPASFDWTSAHSARIVTDIGNWQVVSVQMAWHKGWHARAGGKSIPIARDALGLMTIDPRAQGPMTIELVYDGGVEMRVAKWLSGITAVLLLAWVLRGILKKSW
jgi:hypothetical protein